MDRNKFNLDDVKKMAEDVGHVAVGLGIMAQEKAMPYAEKIGDELKKIVSPAAAKDKGISDDTDKEDKEASVQEEKFDAVAVLNTVIDGAYLFCKITDRKGQLYVGDKEISRMNCESYEVEIANDKVEKAKEAFSEYRKRCFNPIARLSSEKYIIIRWRNGDKSVTCVNSSYYDQIIKILS